MNKRLILRNCLPDGTSKNGFKWNTAIGAVNTCTDWKDNNECGNGLHGWLDGIGDATVSNYNSSPIWLVAEVEAFNDCGGKVKFQSCTVVFTGTMIECSNYLLSQGIRGPIIGLTGDYSEGGDYSALTAVGQRMQSSGHNSTQTAGDKSTQTAGDISTQKAGYYSTQTAGYKSTQTAGDESTQTAGNFSTQKAEHNSTQTAGNLSTQKAGDNSTQTAGYNSTQTAGSSSAQTAGDSSTQTAGYNSTQTAGNYSTQKAGSSSTQTAGYNSTQTAGDESTQTAGDHSNISCGNDCKVTAGLHSVVIHRFWYGSEYKTAVFLIREDKADKTFRYLNGQQIEQ